MNPVPIRRCTVPIRSAHNDWAVVLVAMLVGFLMVFVAASAFAAPFAITSATWDTKQTRLKVEGTGDKRFDLKVLNAYDLGQVLGTSGITGKGEWATQTSKNSPPMPVPCRVRAVQGNGLTAEADVQGAPADCGPLPPEPPNVPPTADANGDYAGTTNPARPVQFDGSGSSDTDGQIVSYLWNFGDGNSSTEESPSHSYVNAGIYQVTLTVTDDDGDSDTDTATAEIDANQGPVAADESFIIDTTVVDRDGLANVPRPGALLHDTDPNGDPLTAALDQPAGNGQVVVNPDGSFTYTPNSNTPGEDSFTYTVSDGEYEASATVNLEVETNLQVNEGKNQFNIMMNYELGMHCTGFEFAYCCVLPPYNSILAQVVKTDKGDNADDFPRLLEGDPNENIDLLGRETVLRDPELDDSGNFKKYVMTYWHEAQPRNDGRGKPQTSTLISAQELNGMFMWNTIYDVTGRDANGSLTTGEYNDYYNVPVGDGAYDEGGYANGWLNHLYIYQGLEGDGATGVDAQKIHLGIDVPVPTDCGPSLQPLGPVTKDISPGADPNATVPNDCGGFSKGNLLTFSGEKGTIVYTQMKVLEDLPIMLTSPGIWEALGLPLTPFEDSIDFFGDPGLVDEDSVRPYVKMKAQLHLYDSSAPNGVGDPVMDNGHPVIGFGTAPIDIPNCERCHSSFDFPNSPNVTGTPEASLVQQEIDFWMAYYDLDTEAGDSDWYARLKGAAISILSLHDAAIGTEFTACYPDSEAEGCEPIDAPFIQETRLGHESVICQKCHADNVIAAVKSASFDPAGTLTIRPITEAVHRLHRNVSDGGVIAFSDSLGRDGGCQGCHPAHRSDGDMANYPIDYGGNNGFADSDNRLAAGGCFVGRDVHSNPYKDTDGAETPAHLNAVGQWLSEKVFYNQAGLAGSDVDTRGIWCTNCHTQLSQEIWKAENCPDLINGECITDVRGGETDSSDLTPVVEAINSALGTSYSVAQAEAWLDPTADNALGDFTHAIWDPQYEDANVATIEVATEAVNCLAPYDLAVYNAGFGVYVCGKYDNPTDEDFNVHILDFCTTPDCVAEAQDSLTNGGRPSIAAPVPFRAATDGRDHWLAPGEPHCADCHAAPYVEPSGGNPANPDDPLARPPFNYPRKASLMRYSKGHQGITCQGCHESIHGLYPVTPTIDTTTYAQAANLNHDGSHGPLKCGACHEINGGQIPTYITNSELIPFDLAVGWAHTYTDETSVLDSGGIQVCEQCHGQKGEDWNEVSADNDDWLEHTQEGRVSREMMDKAEIAVNGAVSTTSDGVDGVCAGCHEGDDMTGNISCDNSTWKEHLTRGRVAHSVWEDVSTWYTADNSTCGW